MKIPLSLFSFRPLGGLLLLTPLLRAQEAAPTGGGPLGNPLIFPILMIVMMYFIIIRPQRKKQKEQENLQKSATTGDRVITIGGAHGVITSVREKTVMVRIADNVKVEFDKSAIATVVRETPPPGAPTSDAAK